MMSQQDGAELFRCFLDALTEGELEILKHRETTEEGFKIDQGGEPESTPYRKRLTHVEQSICSYTVNNVKCLACNHERLTFDIMSDLIIDINNFTEGAKNDEFNDKREEMKVKLEALVAKESAEYANTGMKILNLEEMDDDPIPCGFDKNTDKLLKPVDFLTQGIAPITLADLKLEEHKNYDAVQKIFPPEMKELLEQQRKEEAEHKANGTKPKANVVLEISDDEEDDGTYGGDSRPPSDGPSDGGSFNTREDDQNLPPMNISDSEDSMGHLQNAKEAGEEMDSQISKLPKPLIYMNDDGDEDPILKKIYLSSGDDEALETAYNGAMEEEGSVDLDHGSSLDSDLTEDRNVPYLGGSMSDDEEIEIDDMVYPKRSRLQKLKDSIRVVGPRRVQEHTAVGRRGNEPSRGAPRRPYDIRGYAHQNGPSDNKPYYSTWKPETRERIYNFKMNNLIKECKQNLLDEKEHNLNILLDNHFSTNLLNNKDNYYTCEKCRKTVDMDENIMFITSTHRLYKPAPCIAISLKRFEPSAWGGFSNFNKIDNKVSFPMEIDFSRYVMRSESDKDESYLYRLYAVMVHHGGMGGGHYVAYARHGEKWFYFSDSMWREVSMEEVLGCQAYMLFYGRK